MPAMPRVPSNRLPIVVLAGLLLVGIAVPMTGGELGFGTTSNRGPAASPSASLGAVGSSTPSPSGTSSPSVEPSSTPSPSPAATVVEAAVVPVTHFRTTADATNRREVEAILAGRSGRYEALELVADEADAILKALGAERPSDGDRLILADDAATLIGDMADTRDRLGFIRADEVTPAVRALTWGELALFGVDRVKSLDDWRLRVELPIRGDAPAFDPSATWTLFAGGDVLLDRGVYQTVRVNGRGIDFPFDGGTAEITGRTCCSSFGWPVPSARRTGNEGAVRDLISGADIAIANFENPAPDEFSFHTSGTVFTADPELIDGLVNAGIDYVSIANNHIGDAGDDGILQTIENLEERGLKYSGAGENLAAALEPGILEANGTRVAVLAFDAINRAYFAQRDDPGSSALTIRRVRIGIEAAREAGADVIIVFPHWGVEYNSEPFVNQQRLARQIIEAGADMIIGNHAHYAAALEIHDGKPIWYALGNFVFDQTWSEPTMEGITLELTFHGADLRQVRMRPHIILDKAQPNFLDPAGDGQTVMGQVFDASEGLLPY
jgi:poly-gamma-glutamate synthesis protein (capsule biosynthesis protein)